MAIKISGTTVIDDSRNVVNIQNLNSSGVSTIGTLRVNAGIVSASTGIITYYGDGQYLTNISAGAGGSMTIGRRTTAASINVASGSTTLLTRSGIVTINV